MTLRTRWRPGDRFLVRHKDSAIVVVEKKAGVLSQRTDSGRGEDMLSLLSQFLGRGARVFPVHRLDRVVSGLLVYARTYEDQQRLISQFAAHTVERKYIAAVQGNLQQDSGTFSSNLSTEAMVVRSDEDGTPAVTHWKVLERFKKATLVEVRLETGLRNQIRVHFAEAGYPLLGEKKYTGGNQGNDRIFLHAAVLGFKHPRTKQEMRFEARLPPELSKWKKTLGGAR
jgi:23S rRNA pseudouridine1911/1915/1917 synthase